MAFSHLETEPDFIVQVKSDLTLFVESSSVDSVLVFPPVNSFYRFLIHQLVQDSFNYLRTFSIGEDPGRRIVVCTKDLVARVDAAKDESQAETRQLAAPTELTMVVGDAEKSISTQVKKSRASLPTVGIYRPPAARRSTEDRSKVFSAQGPDSSLADNTTKNATTTSRTRVRRPDQQVYVPRAKRVFKDSEKFEDSSTSTLDNCLAPRSMNMNDSPAKEKCKSGSNLIINDKRSSKPRSSSPTSGRPSLPPRASQLVETKKKLCQSFSSDLDLEGIESRISGETERLPSTMNTVQSVNLPARAEVIVEKKKKLCQTSSNPVDFKWKTKNKEDEMEDRIEDTNLDILSINSGESEQASSNCKNSIIGNESEIASVIDFKVTNNCSDSDFKSEFNVNHESCAQLKVIKTVKNKGKPEDFQLSNSMSGDNNCLRPQSQLIHGTESSDDDYHDAQNEDKTNLLKNICDSSSGGSTESLSSSDSVNSHVSPVQLMKPVKIEPKKKTSTEKPSRVFNPDECDWDALLDEDGDVLDPFLMKELTKAVGQVHVTQPKNDYHNYRSNMPADHQRTRKSTGDDDFNHVVEIFSFPPEFKTPDLVAVLSPFKNMAGGFEIKWVDDTHALGVFASALIAEQVLAYQHPMVRTRPLSDATLESRLKAKRLSESIQSFRPRPETCAALARRLVTGALGVKLPTARQEREEEKRVLREAREKRRLAVQQQDDIWNS